jgi:hypothetical protein
MSFTPPTFETGDLELRCDEGEVMIYGTPHGLARLAELCMKLSQLPDVETTEHYHLEDYELLTTKSLRGALAVFHNQTEKNP